MLSECFQTVKLLGWSPGRGREREREREAPGHQEDYMIVLRC